jgi:hypothetical protein
MIQCRMRHSWTFLIKATTCFWRHSGRDSSAASQIGSKAFQVVKVYYVQLALLAVTRSSNERAVKRSKVSWFIKNGMKHKLSWILTCYVMSRKLGLFVLTLCTRIFNK